MWVSAIVGWQRRGWSNALLRDRLPLHESRCVREGRTLRSWQTDFRCTTLQSALRIARVPRPGRVGGGCGTLHRQRWRAPKPAFGPTYLPDRTAGRFLRVFFLSRSHGARLPGRSSMSKCHSTITFIPPGGCLYIRERFTSDLVTDISLFSFGPPFPSWLLQWLSTEWECLPENPLSTQKCTVWVPLSTPLSTR